MQLSISNVQFIAVCKNFLPVVPFDVLLGKILLHEAALLSKLASQF